MNRRQTTGEHREDVGRIHLQGLDAHDHETFCGFCWSMNHYEDTDDPADCPGCLRAAQEAYELLQQARRLGLWKLEARGSKRKGVA